VLAATVWVGGQLALGALVPALGAKVPGGVGEDYRRALVLKLLAVLASGVTALAHAPATIVRQRPRFGALTAAAALLALFLGVLVGG
jgi:hypothetical protein